MGFSFFSFLKPKNGKTSYQKVDPCDELMEAARDYQVREVCFHICVNMIANAIARCEVRTFLEWQEVRGQEYYLWNIEPNTNPNSASFSLHS